MNTSKLVARNARKYPMEEAIIGMGKRLTFSELDQFVNQFANGLKQQGIEESDKVVLYMPNVPEFAIAYFAVQRLGAIIVPINAKMTLNEVEYIVENCEAKAIIAHELLFSAVEKLAKPRLKIKTGSSIEGWLTYDELLNSEKTPVVYQLESNAPSTILYTSGTTGKPKGVLFSYENIFTVAQMICVEMEMKQKSRVLHMMPLSHSAPLHLFFMAATMMGATSILTPTFTPDLLLESIENERITHFFGAPVAYLLTANHPKINETDLSSMNWWIYGGAPLSPTEVQFVQQKFQTKNLNCVYGLTEAGPSGTLLNGEEHQTKAGSIGKHAVLYTELKIVQPDGSEVAQGEIGEIVIAGEGNMLGYYKNEEATKATFDGEWLKTGDLARKDEDGYIWIVDRKKDVIISGGVNVYPKEIEDELIQHPALVEVAVIGVPHPEWGESVKLFYNAKEQVTEQQLKEFAKERLASYKVPRIYQQVEELPRNASGKILKQQLKERV